MTYQLANVNHNTATNADNFLAYFTKYTTVPSLTGLPLSCTADFNCQVLDNGFWTINAFSNPTTQITGAGVAGAYTMTLYNRDYTNGMAVCISGMGDKGTIIKRDNNAAAWGFPTGVCTNFNFASTARSGMIGFSDFATARTFLPVLLPIELLSFTATYRGQGTVQMQWETLSEKEVDRFVVERSTNGTDFIAIGTQKVSENSNKQKSYTLDDRNAKLGANYYRLKTIDLDRTVSYSKIVVVTIDDIKNINSFLNLYPNPAPKGSEINIANIEKSEVKLQIVSTMGQVLVDSTAKHEGGTFTIQQNLASGIYFVKISTGENSYVLKVIIE